MGWGWIGDVARRVKRNIHRTVRRVYNYTTNIYRTIKKDVYNTYKTVKKDVTNVYRTVKKDVTKVYKTVKRYAGVTADWVRSYVQPYIRKLNWAITHPLKAIKETISKLGELAFWTLKQFRDFVLKVIEEIMRPISTALFSGAKAGKQAMDSKVKKERMKKGKGVR